MKFSRLALLASFAASVAFAEGTTSGTDTTTAPNTNGAGSPTKSIQQRTKSKKKGAKTNKKSRRRSNSAAATADKITTSSASAQSAGAEANVTQSSGNNGLYGAASKKLEMSYFGVYHGGSLSNLSGVQPDIEGNPDPTSPQNLENIVTLGWKPAKDWLIGANLHFFYNGSNFTNGADQNIDRGIQMMNPSLLISKAKLVSNGGFNLKGYMYFELPVSHYDYITLPGHSMLTTITPTANMTYDLPNSRLSLGAYTYLKFYVPGANTPDDLRTWRFYLAPNANFQMTPTVAATLWIDLLDVRRNGGNQFFTTNGLQSMEGDIEPGINWDIIPGHLSLNPILNIYTAHPTLASTSVQMIVVGKAF